ncbi:hypothetical protein [Deinococcus maricopensis]|uniref:DinB-like domain-containing protein n=1 Tax=Deinococcus maricopensis (strain DSM 21211 / LMG 22137 / NRRL B-23946 / LB-34) TaxID=709986 RepID=E8UBG8_DEIML|nr:hypothetical protein [Deinococcus maricopensis]ADV68407.1 hypothetical protein Deima_2778 [Deinococcus maricopensis DSM 21211]
MSAATRDFLTCLLHAEFAALTAALSGVPEGHFGHADDGPRSAAWHAVSALHSAHAALALLGAPTVLPPTPHGPAATLDALQRTSALLLHALRAADDTRFAPERTGDARTVNGLAAFLRALTHHRGQVALMHKENPHDASDLAARSGQHVRPHH